MGRFGHREVPQRFLGAARKQPQPNALRLEVQQAPPVGLSLETIRSDDDPAVTDVATASFAQQSLNDPFALLVAAFAELVMPDSSVLTSTTGHRAPCR